MRWSIWSVLGASVAGCLLPDTSGLRGAIVDASVPVDGGDAGTTDAAAATDAPIDPCAESGLVAFYRFDETGSIAHNCGSGGAALDAVLVDATLVPKGRGFMVSNDSGYAEVQGKHPAFAGGSFTITAWIRPVDYSNSGRIVSNRFPMGADAPTNMDSTLDAAGGNPSIGFYVTSVPALYVDSAPKLNVWSHVAGVHRAAGVNSLSEIWFDGVLVKSEVRERDLSDTPPRIGNDRRGAGLAFRGTLDDVRIYDRALTPQELTAQAKE
ncbi:hypothetical protein BH09MYX1_BH09MYX1_39300 [soil metagenome]